VVGADDIWVPAPSVAKLPLPPPGKPTPAVASAEPAPVGSAAATHASPPMMQLMDATAAVAAAVAAAAIDVNHKRDETGVCENKGEIEFPSRATSSGKWGTCYFSVLSPGPTIFKLPPKASSTE